MMKLITSLFISWWIQVQSVVLQVSLQIYIKITHVINQQLLQVFLWKPESNEHIIINLFFQKYALK